MKRFLQLLGLCVSLTSFNLLAYGPFDYTNPIHFKDKLPVVEQYHFNSNVESLLKGMTSSTPLGDLEYVVRAFPNHHRALNALARYWLKFETHGKMPPGANREKSADYWFNRAISFVPQDGVVKLLYAIYNHGLKKNTKALELYKAAETQIPPNQSAELHYNLGLLYVDLKEYELARDRAEKAYAMGHPLPGLRNKLLRLGIWNTSHKGQ